MRALLAALAVFVCLSVLISFAYREKAQQLSEALTELDQQKAQVRTLTERTRALAKAQAAAQAANLKLKEALNAEPTFRDTAVPAAVRDSLCARIRCSEAVPVPAPAG